MLCEEEMMCTELFCPRHTLHKATASSLPGGGRSGSAALFALCGKLSAVTSPETFSPIRCLFCRSNSAVISDGSPFGTKMSTRHTSVSSPLLSCTETTHLPTCRLPKLNSSRREFSVALIAAGFRQTATLPRARSGHRTHAVARGWCATRHELSRERRRWQRRRADLLPLCNRRW